MFLQQFWKQKMRLYSFEKCLEIDRLSSKPLLPPSPEAAQRAFTSLAYEALLPRVLLPDAKVYLCIWMGQERLQQKVSVSAATMKQLLVRLQWPLGEFCHHLVESKLSLRQHMVDVKKHGWGVTWMSFPRNFWETKCQKSTNEYSLSNHTEQQILRTFPQWVNLICFPWENFAIMTLWADRRYALQCRNRLWTLIWSDTHPPPWFSPINRIKNEGHFARSSRANWAASTGWKLSAALCFPARENNCSIKTQSVCEGAALHHRVGGQALGPEGQASLPGQRKLFANSLRIVTSPGRGDSASIHGTEQLMRSDKAPLSQPAACFQQKKREPSHRGSLFDGSFGVISRRMEQSSNMQHLAEFNAVV